MKSSPGTPSFSLSSFNVQFLLLSIWQRAQVTGEKLHNNSLGMGRGRTEYRVPRAGSQPQHLGLVFHCVVVSVRVP